VTGDIAQLRLCSFSTYASADDDEISVGSRIDIWGLALQNWMVFNLVEKSNPTNIALHISVRFDEKAVVRRSFRNGQWLGNEERSGGFPLTQSQMYVLK
jgi:hypothetical protein